MRIPDHISPLVAYRTWQWDSLGLKSLNNHQWVPGEALQAQCDIGGGVRRSALRLFPISQEVADEFLPNPCSHIAPEDGCTCGVYAAKNLKHLHEIGYIGHGDVYGEVLLWGRVWDHDLGYRAEFAYPKNLVICASSFPFTIREIEAHLQPLLLYNVDISITEKLYEGKDQVLIPLYKKDEGIVLEGMHWLVDQRTKWYTGMKGGVPPIAVGDRVSMRDRGIGVVHSLTDTEVRITLWNKTTYTVPVKSVQWNRQNNRWETDASGYEVGGILWRTRRGIGGL